MSDNPKATVVNLGLGPLRARWPSPKDPDYAERAPEFARAWQEQILREFGAPPAEVSLEVSEYEFHGKTYWSVVARINQYTPNARLWVHHVLCNIPQGWDKTAQKKLFIEQEQEEEIPF